MFSVPPISTKASRKGGQGPVARRPGAEAEAATGSPVMLPAGSITEGTVRELGDLLEPGDVVIDGGNTYFKDDIRRCRVGEKEDSLCRRRHQRRRLGRARLLPDDRWVAGGGQRFDRSSSSPAPASGQDDGRAAATSTAARSARATSSRWSTTASSMTDGGTRGLKSEKAGPR
jgi:hypothetical protein